MSPTAHFRLTLAVLQSTQLPWDVGTLRSLRRLVVNRNKLRELPPSLMSLSALEVCAVSKNSPHSDRPGGHSSLVV